MTEFILQEALGTETNYDNLFDGSHFSPQVATDTTLRLTDANGNALVILGQGMTYNLVLGSVTGGSVLSIHVSNSSSVEVFTIDQFPVNYSAATLFNNFVAHGLAGSFAILSAGNDIFTGNSFANTLNGGTGDDLILGGTGDDLLTGNGG